MAVNPARLVFDMPREEYDVQVGTNWSRLKVMARSPAHYLQARLYGQEDKDAFKYGRAVHLAVLEPERFPQCVVRWDGGRRAGKEWDAFQKKHKGKEILTADEHTDVLALSTAVRMHRAASKYLTRGRAEVSLFWTDAVYNMDCRARPDFVSDAGVLVDLKTTRDASPEGFGREAHRLRYYTQAAWYSDGYEAVTGTRLPFVLVAVEKDAPHVVSVYRVPEELLELGREEYRALLGQLMDCQMHSSWPGYVEDVQDLRLPKWARPVDADEDVTGLGLVFGEGAAQ